MLNKLKLRDYQEDIIKDILSNDYKEGIIVVGTGGGKTILGIELIARLGLTAVIITHTTVISSQWKEEIEKYLDIKPCVIDAGHKEIGQITIVTVQSLAADEELCKELASKTSILLVDECHLFVSDKRIEILGQFAPKYLFGLTGSPFRDASDGKSPVIGFLFGNKVCEFYPEQLKPTVEIVHCREELEMGEYHEIIDSMVDNDNRTTLIFGLGLGNAMEGKRILILTKRTRHAEIIYNKFSDEWKKKAVYLINSEDKNRNELLKELKSGKKDFSIIIGTCSLLSTGTDVPSLDTVILSCDLKSEVLCLQSVGRIMRLFSGKKHATIIDIVDHHPILFRQFKSRLSFYRSKNWIISGI